MPGPSDGTMYGVAVRDDNGLRLLARVRRSKAGDIYFLIPRDDPDWNAHASYHQRGASHVRSYRWKHLSTQRQHRAKFSRVIEDFAKELDIPILVREAFDTEYAEIYGVPFSFIPSAGSATDPKPTPPPTRIRALEDRIAVLVCGSDLRRVARKGGYSVSLLQRLFNQRSTCSTGGTNMSNFTWPCPSGSSQLSISHQPE